MICQTSVQDRLKIRLDALVELPFENSGLLLRLGASPFARACGMSAALWLMSHNLRFLRVQQMSLASSIQAGRSDHQLCGRIQTPPTLEIDAMHC
jgi:hypothetical protein